MKFARTGVALLALVVVACSSTKGSGFGSDGDGNGNGGNGDGTGDGTSPGGFGATGDGGAGGTAVCDPNPANYDVPGDGCDNDGDGTVDNVATCDSSLSATGSANDFVQALGVCQMADSTHWGLVSATYTNGYGSSSAPGSEQHSIRPGFGTNVMPREGASLGVISTGYASEYDDSSNSKSGGQFKDSYSDVGNGTKLPSGFPKASGSCHPASTSARRGSDRATR